MTVSPDAKVPKSARDRDGSQLARDQVRSIGQVLAALPAGVRCVERSERQPARLTAVVVTRHAVLLEKSGLLIGSGQRTV